MTRLSLPRREMKLLPDCGKALADIFEVAVRTQQLLTVRALIELLADAAKDVDAGTLIVGDDLRAAYLRHIGDDGLTTQMIKIPVREFLMKKEH